MKLKYYLRGLGIGILITTVILSLAGIGRKNMTDEEVVKRAKELGMVESTLLSDLPDQTKAEEVRPTEPETSEPETSEPETSLQPETSEQENSAEPEAGPGPETSEPETLEPEVSPEPEETASTPETPAAPGETPVSPEDGNPDTPAGETVTLVIGRGESSTTVSKNLKKAGIVEDAAAFDRFLCNNGYDKKIITGTYEIPYGASEEEIAKIITRK